MQNFNPFSPLAVKKLLYTLHKKPSKALGENYLVDRNASEKIVHNARQINPIKPQLLLEIGAGLGALTQCAIEKNLKIIAVEIDSRSFNFLKNRFPNAPCINTLENPNSPLPITEIPHAQKILAQFLQNNEPLCLIKGNAFLLDFVDRLPIPNNTTLIGNLPYAAAIKLILHFLENYSHILQSLIVMTQKETADKLIAKPNKNNPKSVGISSILTSYHATCSKLFDIPPHLFYPKPNVTSSLIKITPLQKNLSLQNQEYSLFKNLVKASFQKRRSSLKNALLKNNILRLQKNHATLLLSHFPTLQNQRPEKISTDQFIALAKCLFKLNLPTSIILPKCRMEKG